MSPTSEINENRPPNMQTTGITQQNPQQNKCPLGKGRAVPSLGKFVYSCGFWTFCLLWDFLLSLVHFLQLLGVLCLFHWNSMQILSFKSVNHLWCRRDEYVGLCSCLHCYAEREIQPLQTSFLPQNGLFHWPPALSPSWSGSSLIQRAKRQNSEFSLTQVPICLSITAVTIYLLGLNLTATQCSNFLHVPLDVLLYYCLQSAEARFCICGKACWEMSPLWPHLF